MLIVVSGLPGTGKSAVAERVARRLGAVQLSIDDIEDALLGAGLAPGWTTGVAAYEAVRAAAEQNLALGRVVVVDAVNDSEPARETWRRAADATNVPVLFFVLTLDDDAEHRRRLDGRRRNLAHVREPSWEDVRRRAESVEPWVGGHEVIVATPAVDEIAAHIAASASAHPSLPTDSR
jgi:predicted kinase